MLAIMLCVFLAIPYATESFIPSLANLPLRQEPAPLELEDSPDRVPGEYIVVFEADITDGEVSTHIQAVNVTNAVLFEYRIGTFRGYAAVMDDELRDCVRNVSHVSYVQFNLMGNGTSCCRPKTQMNAPWGIVRTTVRNKPVVTDYIYSCGAGKGVDVYIIDSGIDTAHPDFGGRAQFGIDFVDDPSPMTDLHGHGTHVAGIVISNTYGLAREARAISVRTLDRFNRGFSRDYIRALMWVVQQHTSGKNRKSIANIAFKVLGRDRALNTAVEQTIKMGVHVVVSAGNWPQDACNTSPARVQTSVTVAASDRNDNFWPRSARGTCVDIIAPGVEIVSVGLNNGVSTFTGTSQASAHASGVMAKYLSEMPAGTTPAQLKNTVINTATQNRIMNVPNQTPNKLIYKRC